MKMCDDIGVMRGCVMASGTIQQPIRVLVMNDNKQSIMVSMEQKQQSNSERDKNNKGLHTFMPGNDAGDAGMCNGQWYHPTTNSGIVTCQ
jgi:hypothetical protein